MTIRLTIFSAALAMLASAGCSKCDNDTGASSPGTTTGAPSYTVDAGSGTGATVTGTTGTGTGSATAPSASGAMNGSTGAAGTAGEATVGASGTAGAASGSAGGSVTVTGTTGVRTGGSGDATLNAVTIDAGPLPRNVGAGTSNDSVDRKADGTSARGGGNVGDGMAHPTAAPAPPPKP